MQLDEPLIDLKRILLDRDQIGFVGGERREHRLGDGALTLRRNHPRGRRLRVWRGGRARRWRRRGRRGRKEDDFGGQSHRGPGHLLAAGRLIDLHARALEDLVEVEPGLAHQHHQAAGIKAVAALAFDRDLTGRARHGDQHARWRFHEGKAGRHRLFGAAAETVVARRVDHHHARGGGGLGEGADEFIEPEGDLRHIACGRDRRVDRNEKVLAGILRGLAGEIEERRRGRAGGRDLVEEGAHRRPDVGLTNVGQFGDIEARRAQGLGDYAGVGDRRLERRRGVGAVADYQGDARLRQRRA